jgi:methyl-accepting chemotaxis protein
LSAPKGRGIKMKVLKNVRSVFFRRNGKFIFSINAKIISLFIAVILVMGSISFFPLTMYKEPINEYDSILKNIISANTTISNAKDVAEITRQLVINTNDEDLKKEYKAKLEAMNKTIDELESGLMSDTSRVLFEGCKKMVSKFEETANKAVNSDTGMSITDRSKYLEEVKKTDGYIDSQFKAVISEEIIYSQVVRDDLQKMTSKILVLTLTILLADLAVCLFFGFIIARKISIPVKNISRVADKLALGDLTINEVDVKSKDELRLLADSFNKMIKNLKEMISKVSDSSGQVIKVSEQLYHNANQSSSASEHIAESIQQVADGASDQAKLSEKSALTMDRMYSSIKHISDKSTLAKQSSDVTNSVTQEGNLSINKVVDQINSINTTISESSLISEELFKKSKEIGNIVDVITSIAGQTNLLALNAAIEAARAGDMGNGFAVVADEVRKLAEQSGSAANKITEIIHDIQSETAKMSGSMKKSIDEIKIGIEVTGNAGKAFERINLSIASVSEQINDIYSEIMDMNSSIEGIKSVSDNIVGISKTSAGSSQEVAASVEELSAGIQEVLSTSHVLNDLANELQKLVQKFKL